jgi:redox-sensing transcriptional repressor
MKSEKISESTTNRLSVYLRCLKAVSASGAKTISSKALADDFHLNSAQMRKDLAYFGEFGVRGLGYSVDTLCDHLTKILGLDKEHRVAIIGAGRLGTALADYYGFRKANFTVKALFDNDPEKIGTRIGEVKVLNAKSFAATVKRDNIEVAVIAVPASCAQMVFEDVVGAGIKAVLNFAPAALRKSSSDVKLKTVDLTTSLESLSFFLAQPAKQNSTNRKRKPKGNRNTAKVIKK